MFLPRLVGEIGLLVDCRGLWGDQRARNYAHPGFFSAMTIADYRTARRGLTELHRGDVLASTEGELAQTGRMDGSAWWRVGFWRCG